MVKVGNVYPAWFTSSPDHQSKNDMLTDQNCYIRSVDICQSCVGLRHPLTIILLGEMQNHSTRTCETFQWDGVAERLIQTNGFSDATYILNLHIYAIGLTRMLSDVSVQLRGDEIFLGNL